MEKGKKLDLAVLFTLLASISLISGMLLHFSVKFEPRRIASLAILYNAGLGADCRDFMENSSYTYDDKVVKVYGYFTESGAAKPALSTSIKMHNVSDEAIFATNPAIDRLIPSKAPREIPGLKSKLLDLTESNRLLSEKGQGFRLKLAESINEALLDFSRVKVDISVGGKLKTLDLSKLDLRVVVSIMVVESCMNPFALMEERSLDASFSPYVYSRGLMQIYEMTLWMLNSWLKESRINIKPEELWSVRNNIFLGMVYLAYANEILGA